MIKSMTGFASIGLDIDHASVGVTVRTVNHRYLDVQVRTPQALAAEESGLRALVQERMSRGRVEVSVVVRSRRPARVEVALNESLVAELASVVDRARGQGLIQGALGPGDLLRLPQAVSFTDAEPDADEQSALAAAATEAVRRAVDAVETMRVTEGEHLRDDLEARLSTVSALVGRLEAAATDGAEALRVRLNERVAALATDVATDEAAVAQEVVRFVARSDVSEELVRLRGHLAHWTSLAEAPEPCGRKLDFLLQEMNREVNTLAAKAEGAGVSETVIAMKAELEKLREQVQNVE